MYCIDASSLINSYNERYPIDVFPKVWVNIDDLIEKGLLIATSIVLDELSWKDDGIFSWVKEREGQMIVVPDETIQKNHSRLLERFPHLVSEKSEKTKADTFIIATAQVTESIVVTQEHPDTNPLKPKKIPDVCDELGVPHINIVEMFRRQGWEF